MVENDIISQKVWKEAGGAQIQQTTVSDSKSYNMMYKIKLQI